MVPVSERPLRPDAKLVEVVRAIEASQRRIAVVVDEAHTLLGTLTDGDVRRCLLTGHSLESRAADAMNGNPVTAAVTSPESLIGDRLKAANVRAMPLVDDAGRYVRCIHVDDLTRPDGDWTPSVAEGFAAAVIMAGGEGRRLRPLTDELPKPMVDIGGLPLIERQVRRLARAGLRRIFISVNYLSHVIKEHFGDGAQLDVEIVYLHEETKLGTGGALALLPEPPAGPLIVMNGDILTTVDFVSLLHFHQECAADVTVAAIEHRVVIPYGALNCEGAFVTALEEKPTQRFLCNAGVYALQPDVLRYLPAPRFYNLTDLIQDCLNDQRSVAVFPVHEYWSDIGTNEELQRARASLAATVGQDD